MTMKPFAHAHASSVEEAVAALDEGCRPLAGGTDLLGMMKAGLVSPQRLVNLKTIPGLDQIVLRDDGTHIGALTVLARLAGDPVLNGRPEVACLVEAIVQSASPQLRHMATVGGNQLQRPRCWYYRNRLIPCWRKGGQTCYAFRGENKYHVILGGGPCHATHPSDPAVALLSLDARVVVAGPAGARSLPLGEIYRLPAREERNDTVLAWNELITEVIIPPPAGGSRSTYVKVAERAAWDFALVSAAAQVTLVAGVVQGVRIALGGVAPIPWRATDAERALVGHRLTARTLDEAARAATAGARPLAHNAYKVDLLQGVVRQALGKLAAG